MPASNSLTRGESNVLTIDAEEYVGILNRGTPEARGTVNEELVRLVEAVPMSVRPEVRTALLEALLGDLEDREHATWTHWPVETTTLALAAVKVLSRNPIGSEPLSQPKNINIVLHHTALPLPPAANPFSTPACPAGSSAAQEALKVIANLLVLRPEIRTWAAGRGLGAIVARDLAGMDESSPDMERLFLISRIGFLMAVDGGPFVQGMINENVVESSASMLASLAPIPANFVALTELLKLVHAVLSHSTSSTGNSSSEAWSDRFDVVVAPLLSLLYNLPLQDLRPPLSQVIHALLLVPFDPPRQETWLAAPKARVQLASSAASPSRSFKALFGSLSTSEVPRRSFDSGRLSSMRPGDASHLLPKRLLGLLQAWFETHVPFGIDIDGDEVSRTGLDVDGDLPPLALLLVKICAGDASVRQALRDAVLPADLDRSSESGPLEKRRGLLGDLLRTLTCSTYAQSRGAMEEFFWALADRNGTRLVADIGYGNAAGLMFRKGIEAPASTSTAQSATITELPDESTSAIPAGSSEPIASRHPISALANEPESGIEQMTEEEKEREAERLFVLFERMERNRVISTGSPGGQGVDMMRKAVEEGKGEEWERIEEEKRLEELDEADKRDEVEALKELAQLKARQRRS